MIPFPVNEYKCSMFPFDVYTIYIEQKIISNDIKWRNLEMVKLWCYWYLNVFNPLFLDAILCYGACLLIFSPKNMPYTLLPQLHYACVCVSSSCCNTKTNLLYLFLANSPGSESVYAADKGKATTSRYGVLDLGSLVGVENFIRMLR